MLNIDRQSTRYRVDYQVPGSGKCLEQVVIRSCTILFYYIYIYSNKHDLPVVQKYTTEGDTGSLLVKK